MTTFNFPWQPPQPVTTMQVSVLVGGHLQRVTLPPPPTPEELAEQRRQEIWVKFDNRCEEIYSLLTKQPNNKHRQIRAANQLVRLMQFVKDHQRNGNL